MARVAFTGVIFIVAGCATRSTLLEPNHEERMASPVGVVTMPKSIEGGSVDTTLCEPTHSLPLVPVLGLTSDYRLSYADGTLWENGRSIQEQGVNESLRRICLLQAGRSAPKHEVRLDLPEKARAWELQKVTEQLGLESYVTLQVKQAKRHVRFGVSPFHPETPFSGNDSDVLVVYVWGKVEAALVRGVERAIVGKVEVDESQDFCNETVAVALKKLCEVSFNNCRRVSIYVWKYKNVSLPLSVLSLLDSVSPTQQLRLVGFEARSEPMISERMRLFPSAFAGDLHKGECAD